MITVGGAALAQEPTTSDVEVSSKSLREAVSWSEAGKEDAEASKSPTLPEVAWRTKTLLLKAGFGEQVLPVEYGFRNDSTEEVRVEVVRTSAKDLVAPKGPLLVKAGESGKLVLRYDIGKQRGVQRGSIWVRVTKASDPAPPPLERPKLRRPAPDTTEEEKKHFAAQAREAMKQYQEQEKQLTKLDLIVRIAQDLELAPAAIYWSRDHIIPSGTPDPTAKPVPNQFPGLLSETQRAIIISLPIPQDMENPDGKSPEERRTATLLQPEGQTAPPPQITAVEVKFPPVTEERPAPPVKLLATEQLPDGTWQLTFERTLDPVTLTTKRAANF